MFYATEIRKRERNGKCVLQDKHITAAFVTHVMTKQYGNMVFCLHFTAQLTFSLHATDDFLRQADFIFKTLQVLKFVFGEILVCPTLQ